MISRWGSVIYCLVLVLSVPIMASEFEFEPITSDDWAVGPDSTDPSPDAVMIFEKMVVDDRELGKERVYVTIHRRIRVLTAEGMAWGDVTVPYYHEDQKLEEVKGQAIRRDGEIAVLSENQVIEKDAIHSKKLKVKQHSFSLPGMSDDCVIEYFVKLRVPESIDRWLIQKDIRLLSGELRWHVQQMGYYQARSTGGFSAYLLDPLIETECETLRANLKIQTRLFRVANVEPFVREAYSLPENHLCCTIRIYYGPRESAASYWRQLTSNTVDWFDKLTRERWHVKRLAKKYKHLESDYEKCVDIYSWLHDSVSNIDYTCDNCDYKKLAEKYNSVEKALQKQIGTSTMINLMFCDALQEIGVEARIAWAVDADEDLLVRDAKYWQFDRTLIMVPDPDGQYVFCSSGQPATPFGTVAWYNEGVRALVTGIMGTTFMTVPVSAAGDNRTVRSLELAVSNEFDVSGWWRERITGQRARSLRLRLNGQPEKEQLVIVGEMLEEVIPTAEVDSLVIEGLDQLEEPLSLSCYVSFPSLEDALVGDRLLLNPLEYCEERENHFTSNHREHAIVYRYAHQLQQILTVGLPDGWTVETLPSDSVFSCSVGSCGASFVAFGNQLSVQSSFVINSPFNTVEQYSEFQELYSIHNALSKMTASIVSNDDSETE